MKLKAIEREEFPLWKAMRQELCDASGDSCHEQAMRKMAAGRDWYCRFITDRDGEIIGLVEVSVRNVLEGCLTSPLPCLESLFFMPGHRGLGLEGAVMEMLLDWAVEQGYEEFAAVAEPGNTRAREFYGELGFEEAARSVTYLMRVRAGYTS